MSLCRRAFFIVSLVVLAACTQSGSSFIPARQSDAGTSQAARAKVTIELGIAANVVRAHGLRPDYFSPNTKSVVILENGKALGTFNIKLSSCASGGGTLCIFFVNATTGKKRVFTVSAYDQKDGKGKLLSRGKVVKTVGSGTTTIAVTLAGKVASVHLALVDGDPPAGTAADIAVIVMAKDPDGKVIVGPGKYGSAVTLSDSDPTHATKLSTNKVTSPSQTVTLAYDGTSLTSATISARAAGVAGAKAVFAPQPTVLASYELPTSIGPHTGLSLASWAITLGADSNLWLSAEDDNFNYGAIMTMSPKGKFATFVPGTGTSLNLPNDEFSALVKAADGKVWYVGGPFGVASGDVGNIATDGTTVNYPFSGIGGACTGMESSLGASRIVNAADGGLWFTAFCTAGSVLVHATTGGTFKVNAFPTFQGFGLVNATDGKIYIAGFDTGTNTGAILRASVTGDTVTGTSIIDAPGAASESLTGIVQTRDGDLWAMNNDFNAAKALVRVHLASGFAVSSITQYQTLAFGEEPAYPIVLADGTMWIPESNVQKVTRLTTSGEKAPLQYDLSVPGPPTVYPCMWDVALGNDKNLYFNNNCRRNGAPNSSNVIKLAY